MPLITNIDADWTAGEVLAKRTLFQVRSGQVLIETGSVVPTTTEGAILGAGDALELDAGVTVYWRREGNSVATIARVELEA